MTHGTEVLLTMFDRDRRLKTVTYFLGDLSKVKSRIRVTRVFKNKGDFRVTIGKPNYAEREFLKDCKRAKCNPRRTWLHYFPERKRK